MNFSPRITFAASHKQSFVSIFISLKEFLNFLLDFFNDSFFCFDLFSSLLFGLHMFAFFLFPSVIDIYSMLL